MLVWISWYSAGGTLRAHKSKHAPSRTLRSPVAREKIPLPTLQLCASFPIPGIYPSLRVPSKSLLARANECEGILGGEYDKNTLSNVCLGFKWQVV